jgi:hypothetical protein
MIAAQLNNPIDELVSFFFVPKKGIKKNDSYFNIFSRAAVNRKALNKIDTLIDQLDELLVIVKSNECDFSSKEQLKWIEEGKFLLKLVEMIESLIDTVDGDNDDISNEISKRLISIGNKVTEIITLAELYNETLEIEKEFDSGKTLTIDEAFAV